MKLNEKVQIVGKNVILVPYEAKHVPKYHQWMESEELRELTASERLTLDEEFQMQQSWRTDDDKLTFLVLDRRKFEASGDEIEALIGDTNIFVQLEEDPESKGVVKTGEAEIMIAEQCDRGRGFGYEAMLQMLRYGVDALDIKRFVAKIGLKNEKSIKMFLKMGMEEETRSEVFQEVTMSVRVTKEWRAWLSTQISYEEKDYSN